MKWGEWSPRICLGRSGCSISCRCICTFESNKIPSPDASDHGNIPFELKPGWNVDVGFCLYRIYIRYNSRNDPEKNRAKTNQIGQRLDRERSIGIHDLRKLGYLRTLHQGREEIGFV